MHALSFHPRPFEGDTANDLYRRVLRGEYKPPSFISPEARDLLRRMLTVEPTRRATVEDVLAHPWTAASFTQADDPRRYNPNNQRYMQRLIAHIREQDKVCRRSGPGAPWWWTYEGAAAFTTGAKRSGGFIADSSKGGAIADTRLGEMLGTRLQHNNQPSFDMIGLIPQVGSGTAPPTN